MAIIEWAVRKIAPDIGASERRAKLIQLSDQAIPTFRDLVNSHAQRIVEDFTPKRLRQLLEKHKFVIAIVDKKGAPAFTFAVSRSYYDKSNYGVVVINARKLVNLTTEQRNEAMADLIDQFSRNRSNMAESEIFAGHSRWSDALREAETALREFGFKPDDAHITEYG